jgi:hypothetical protein
VVDEEPSSNALIK